MGQDGKVTHLTTSPYWSSTINDLHKWTAKDAFGYGIGYFGTDSTSGADYASITAAANYGNRWLCKIPTALGDNLYNGNIRHVVIGLLDESEAAVRNRATAYKHDQLQRLKYTYNYYNTGIDYSSITGASWTYLRENVSYDANGNINSLQRYDDNATTPALMDDFVYRYNGNTNKLNYVIDNVSTPGISTDKETQSANNYAYDEIGQLTADNDAGISNIVWNVIKKPLHIVESGKDIYFEYSLPRACRGDEMGHRVKKEIRTGSENNWTQQWYVLDPQGNPVAVYEHKYTNPSGNNYNEMIDLKEHQIYGSDRLGTRNYSNYHLWEATFTCSSFNVDHTFHSPSGKTELTILPSSYQLNKRITGNKYYELKNHTNNVQSVMSDYKIPYASCTTGVANVSYYYSNVITYTDYYGFGMAMPGTRSLNGGNYRYGFGGQEQDKEILGNQNSYTAEYWQYDPRLGRRWNLDQIDQVSISNYAAFKNNPIYYVDIIGNEPDDWWAGFLFTSLAPNSKAGKVIKGFAKGAAGQVKGLYELIKWAHEKASDPRLIPKHSTLAGLNTKSVSESMQFMNEFASDINQMANGFIQHYKDLYNGVIAGDGEAIGESLFELTTLVAPGVKYVPKTLKMVRTNLAKSFYVKAGYIAEDALAHMEGINFEKAVQTTTLKKGTVVQQWVGERGQGNYYTTVENGAQQNLGLSYEGRTLKQFTLTEDVKVLKSTAADIIKDGALRKGGGVQYFSKEIKGKSVPLVKTE